MKNGAEPRTFSSHVHHHKNKQSKCLTITIGIKNGTWKIDFQCQSIIWGEKDVFVVVEQISDDVRCTSFPLTLVANSEVCTTTNC